MVIVIENSRFKANVNLISIDASGSVDFRVDSYDLKVDIDNIKDAVTEEEITEVLLNKLKATDVNAGILRDFIC